MLRSLELKPLLIVQKKGLCLNTIPKMGQLQHRALHAQPSGGLGLMSAGRGWKVPSGGLRMGRDCDESQTRTWEKCHICLPDLVVTRASAYGSSHRQDTGQSVPLVCFMSLFHLQTHTGNIWAISEGPNF